MSPWHRLVAMFRTLAHGDRLDRELDDELRAYVELLRDEKIRAGLSENEATRAALIETGGVQQVKERVREGRTGIWLETVWTDTRYAVRGLGRAPWFTVTAVLSLALGIGLNTAIFSAAEALLLRDLPYRDPARIVEIDQTASTWGPMGVMPGVFEEWRQRATSFESTGVYLGGFNDAIFRDGSTTARVDVTRMSSGVFDVLGVPALIGRRLRAEDDHHGARVAVLSYQLWEQRWNLDAGVVGRSLDIDGEHYRVVGVMPEGFRFYHYPGIDKRLWSDIYLSDPWAMGSRSSRWSTPLVAIARLKDGVSAETANSEIAAIAASTDYGPAPPEAQNVTLSGMVSGWDLLDEDVPARLYLLWGIAMLLLLLATANLANLQLARAGARGQELGIRAAIGASRLRIARQLLTESLVLSLLGGVAGLTLAVWAGPLVATFIPDTNPMFQLHRAGVNWRVTVFMTAVATLAGVAFGIAPAFRGSKARGPTMQPSGRSTETRGVVRTQAALTVAQLAISVVLLAGAGLMITTLSRLWAMPRGFEPGGLVTFMVRLPRAMPWVQDIGVLTESPPAGTSSSRNIYFREWIPTPHLLAMRQRLIDRLLKVPGAHAATVATGIPDVRSLANPFSLPNRPATKEGAGRTMMAIGVEASPGYFDALGMRMFAGRDFTTADHDGGRPVAVIDRRTARAYWPHESQALGDLVEYDGRIYDIVGIVNDVRFWVWSDEPRSTIYMPFRADMAPRSFHRVFPLLHQNVAVRLAREDDATMDRIRNAVAEVTGGIPMESVRSMREARMDASGNTPGITLITAGAGTAALLLAAVGTFGIVSYTVAQRTREIGIRVALGATRRAIVGLLAASTLRLALGGAVCGALLSLWLLRFLAGELFPGMSASHPGVLVGVGSMLVAIAVIAACLPARRAANADPSAALRVD